MRLNFRNTLFAVALIAGGQNVLADSLQHIQDSGELDVCVNPFQPPFSVRQPEVQGLQIDVAKALADSLGVNLNLSWIVQKRDSKKTRCDLYAGVARLGDGKSKYVRITQPYMELQFKLVLPADSQPVKGLDDLKQTVVGVPAGSMGAHLLNEGAVPVAIRFNDELSRLQAVVDGEIGAALVSNVTLGYMQKQGHSFNVYDAEALLGNKLNYLYALGLRKADDATETQFNELLKTLKEDGSLDKVLNKYGVSAL
ncbi:substrate-binding periplasmic protein [Pontibacter sp. JAM-7]|uniref:substrate-binding periplasmic protein n=1 Tax=Pontibacter sp. JAM-7 TaxID=3366581 RepID=UPI003AF9EB20